MQPSSVFSRTLGGSEVLYSNRDTRYIRHPWQTTLFHSGEWSVSVWPGFVNGRAAVYRRTKSTSDGAPDIIEDTDLTDEPEMMIPNKPSFFTKTPRPLPFFADMGFSAVQPDVVVGEGGVQINTDAAKKKFLLQTTVFLAQARATQKMTVNTPANFVQGDLVEYSMVYDNSSVDLLGERPFIRIEKELPTVSSAPVPGGTNTGFTDAGMDYLEVATVYFVPPSEATAGDVADTTVPDNTWTPYVKHNLFWNLCYQSKTDIPWDIPKFRLDPVTAFYVGRYTSAPAATAGAVFAEGDRVFESVFNSASNRGRFWTM